MSYGRVVSMAAFFATAVPVFIAAMYLAAQ
jgi:hypothetical protein